jgi:hypothetical protein
MHISSYPEGELLKIASGFKKHLKANFSTIQSGYSGLDQGFIYKFKALFYEVQAYPTELEEDSIINKYKLDLEALTDQVRNFVLIFRFYLQKAFPYDSKIWEAYGFIEIENVIHDYSSLSTFLKETVKLIEEKRSFLRAANCPHSTLEEIMSLSKLISDENEEMLKHLQRKEMKNKAYQNNLKELFKLMEIIHEAASKSLQDNPESLKHLTFPRNKYIH